MVDIRKEGPPTPNIIGGTVDRSQFFESQRITVTERIASLKDAHNRRHEDLEQLQRVAREGSVRVYFWDGVLKTETGESSQDIRYISFTVTKPTTKPSLDAAVLAPSSLTPLELFGHTNIDSAEAHAAIISTLRGGVMQLRTEPGGRGISRVDPTYKFEIASLNQVTAVVPADAREVSAFFSRWSRWNLRAPYDLREIERAVGQRSLDSK